MMRKNKAVKILRNTKKTALLIYAAAFILLIVAGVRVSGITKEAVRGNDRHKPYEQSCRSYVYGRFMLAYIYRLRYTVCCIRTSN